MQTLREIYETHEGFLINKWEHYIDIYDIYFSKYRNTDVVFLEIGVAHGGSLQMWRRYFGESAILIGVDVNPECKQFEDENTTIYIGSQEDENFLFELKKKIPKVDILLDDGGHTMRQQILTFKILYDHIKDDGIYACEDLHTSYWKDYGGGYKAKGSFIELCKGFIDNLHGWHAKSHKTRMSNYITRTAYGLHFYDSMIFMEKKLIKPPTNSFRGSEQITQLQRFADYGHSMTIKRLFKKILKPFLKR